MLFPSASTVDKAVCATLEESQEDTLREYTHTKLQILQCAYLEKFLRGDFTDYVGRWIYLVGNGIWRNETFDREDDAIERGCSDSVKGYPRGVFTALVVDKDQDQELLIPDLKMEIVRLNSVTDSLLVLENEEVVSSIKDKSNVPLKNKANPHSIPFLNLLRFRRISTSGRNCTLHLILAIRTLY